MSEPFQPGQLRTLQRRVKEWRTAIARRLVLGCEQATLKITREEKEEVTSFKRIGASAPRPRSGIWLAIGRTNFAVAPRCRQAVNEAAQF